MQQNKTTTVIMNTASGTTSEAPTTVVVGGGAAATPVASRWNPTKEQINILENLYKQGLRTPTADQIQEITTRLQTYGHIEGKNVFYWFQNHKARQRQKEKQDHLSLFRHYNHHHRHHLHHPFIHLSPPPNVVYEQCYIPQSNLGFYVSPTTTAAAAAAAGGIKMPENAVVVARESDYSHHHQQTLNLFPMHPTGVLQEAVDTAGNGGCVASRACTSRLPGGTVDRVYFDFFC